jgi:hypothetical protein
MEQHSNRADWFNREVAVIGDPWRRPTPKAQSQNNILVI